MVRISKDEREFQLQLWNGTEYATTETGARDALEEAFTRSAGTPRRLVATEKKRATVPPRWYRRPPLNRSASAQYRGKTWEARSVVADYVAWAKAAGLKRITAYSHAFVGVPKGMDVRLVEREDFIGEAPQPEADEAQDA